MFADPSPIALSTWPPHNGHFRKCSASLSRGPVTCLPMQVRRGNGPLKKIRPRISPRPDSIRRGVHPPAAIVVAYYAHDHRCQTSEHQRAPSVRWAVDAGARPPLSPMVTDGGAVWEQKQQCKACLLVSTHRLRVAQIARSFQNIPIKMKSPTSAMKETIMIATVRNTSLAERGFMNASCLPKSRSATLSVTGRCLFKGR